MVMQRHKIADFRADPPVFSKKFGVTLAVDAFIMVKPLIHRHADQAPVGLSLQQVHTPLREEMELLAQAVLQHSPAHTGLGNEGYYILIPKIIVPISGDFPFMDAEFLLSI